jgi:mannose-6-phosphate isomerase-like protein (cupin superfamily)
MKLVKREDARRIKITDNCTAVEYRIDDKDIDCSIGEINGRYPDKGYCVNEECKELIYVLKGSGTLNKKDEVIHFDEGDSILIDKGEVYYWEGNFTVLMPCVPAWYPEQHKYLDN